MMKVQLLCHVEFNRGEGVHGTTNVHHLNVLTPTIQVLDEDELRSVVAILNVVEGGIGLGRNMLVACEGVYPGRHCVRVAQILPVTW